MDAELQDLKLTGTQLERLQHAICAAFPDGNELSRMVRFRFEQNLDSIAGNGKLADIVFRLMVWAEAKGRTAELIRSAISANPNNPQLNAFRIDLATYYKRRADNHRENGRVNAAIEDYKQALELDTTSAIVSDIRGHLAWLYHNRGEHTFTDGGRNANSAMEASADLNQAVGLVDISGDQGALAAWAYLHRGECYAALYRDSYYKSEKNENYQDYYNTAEASFNHTIDTSLANPSNGDLADAASWAYYHRSDLYRVTTTPNFAKALLDLDEAISIALDRRGFQDQLRWSYLRRGEMYHNQGRYKAALIEYIHAERLGFEESNLYNDRIGTYTALGFTQEEAGERAEEDRRRAAERKSSNEKSH